MQPGRYVGRAPQQVESFVRNVATPIRQRYGSQLGEHAELRV